MPTTGKQQKKASQVKFLFSPFLNLLLSFPCFHYRMPHQQVDPMTPKLSELTALPKNVPIDWFEPAYWNLQLTVREKAHYIADGVCITFPVGKLCEKWEDIVKWKGLSQGNFMEQFGNSVLTLYQIPTPEDIKQLEEQEEEDDEDEVEEDLTLRQSDD